MFIKYLTNKSIMLWDKYLLQILFATRIRVYIIYKKSLFYLLYNWHSILSLNNNSLKSFKVFITIKEYKK